MEEMEKFTLVEALGDFAVKWQLYFNSTEANFSAKGGIWKADYYINRWSTVAATRTAPQDDDLDEAATAYNDVKNLSNLSYGSSLFNTDVSTLAADQVQALMLLINEHVITQLNTISNGSITWAELGTSAAAGDLWTKIDTEYTKADTGVANDPVTVQEIIDAIKAIPVKSLLKPDSLVSSAMNLVA